MNEQEKRLAAEARNAYARKWRAENKDKVRANNAKYWLRKAIQKDADKDKHKEEEINCGTSEAIPESAVK